VCVSQPAWALRAAALWLARACTRRAEKDGLTPPAPGERRPQARQFAVDARFLGRGYGHPTPEGSAATEVARDAGLTLDPTYTAKAFAGALWHLRARRARTILYWHTLSSAPMGPLLSGAPSELVLSEGLRNLLLPGG
jgi:hypothetical protein